MCVHNGEHVQPMQRWGTHGTAHAGNTSRRGSAVAGMRETVGGRWPYGGTGEDLWASQHPLSSIAACMEDLHWSLGP